MLTGVYYFPTDYGIDISELARALEDRGYDALFVCEHTHIPTSRRTPARSRFNARQPKRESACSASKRSASTTSCSSAMTAANST